MRNEDIACARTYASGGKLKLDKRVQRINNLSK